MYLFIYCINVLYVCMVYICTACMYLQYSTSTASGGTRADRSFFSALLTALLLLLLCICERRTSKHSCERWSARFLAKSKSLPRFHKNFMSFSLAFNCFIRRLTWVNDMTSVSVYVCVCAYVCMYMCMYVCT